MNEDQMIHVARQRDEAAARALGDHTPVEQILATMSDQYAIFVQCAAIVDAVARQEGVNCHCHGEHVPNCPVAEAVALVRRMASM